MPKDRRSSSNKCRASPYSCYDKNDDRKEPKSPSLQVGYESEFEEARCPICMEHPHNAVLLLCSSLEKGCRPYMCDTNPRHSNCLDQFHMSNMNKVREQTKLACPLCRGEINGWAVVDPARQFMDSKARNCSLATCDFVGNYTQLEEHASRVHPCLRPTDVDPERELEWRHLEEDMGEQGMLNMQFEYDEDDDDDGDYVLSESELASDNLLDDSDSMFDFSSADE
ncbi:putative Zinc finger, RING/FYVE/PHD-type [Helianthus annuus]|nr:putative Zinc finger, RING/FYVE/PHD-type [Helianthus annuus]